MRRSTVAIVAALTLNGVLAVSPARAADPEEPPPPGAARRRTAAPTRPHTESASSESGLGALQFLVGVGGTISGFVLLPLGPLAAIGFLATPVIVGHLVCAVGNRSDRVQGSCWPAVGGAVAGALLSIPLAYGLYSVSEQSEEEFVGNGILLGLGLGWFVLQPLVSTLVWNAYADPKAYALLPARDLERPRIRPPSYRRPGLGATGQLTVPVLVARF